MSAARPTELMFEDFAVWQEDYQSSCQVIENDTCVSQVSHGPVSVHQAPLPKLCGIPEDLQVRTTPLFQVLCATWARMMAWGSFSYSGKGLSF